MDSLHFSIAVVPLAVYLLLVGLINLFRAPFVTSGARDVTALGIALCGFAVIGPMELFHPEAAASRFHGWVWVLLLIFYGLSVSLTILLMRPRIVIYNTSVEQVMPVLKNLLARLDKESRWAGDSAVMPGLGIQLYVQPFPAMRNVQLVANGSKQSFDAWRKLETEIAAELKPVRSSVSPLGYALIAAALMIAATSSLWMLYDQQNVVQALNEMLRQ